MKVPRWRSGVSAIVAIAGLLAMTARVEANPHDQRRIYGFTGFRYGPVIPGGFGLGSPLRRTFPPRRFAEYGPPNYVPTRNGYVKPAPGFMPPPPPGFLATPPMIGG